MFGSEHLWSRNAFLNHLTQAKREMCQDRENITAEVNRLRSVLTPLTGIYLRTKKSTLLTALTVQSHAEHWTERKPGLHQNPEGVALLRWVVHNIPALYRAVKRNWATAPFARGCNTHGEPEKDIKKLSKLRILLKSFYFKSYDGFLGVRQHNIDKDISGNKHHEIEPDSTGSLLTHAALFLQTILLRFFLSNILKSQSWFNIHLPLHKKEKSILAKKNILEKFAQTFRPTGRTTTYSRNAKISHKSLFSMTIFHPWKGLHTH